MLSLFLIMFKSLQNVDGSQHRLQTPFLTRHLYFVVYIYIISSSTPNNVRKLAPTKSRFGFTDNRNRCNVIRESTRCIYYNNYRPQLLWLRCLCSLAPITIFAIRRLYWSVSPCLPLIIIITSHPSCNSAHREAWYGFYWQSQPMLQNSRRGIETQ